MIRPAHLAVASIALAIGCRATSTSSPHGVAIPTSPAPSADPAGKYADLIVVDGQPDVRRSDIRKIVTVMKNGVAYSSPDLYAAIAIHP